MFKINSAVNGHGFIVIMDLFIENHIKNACHVCVKNKVVVLMREKMYMKLYIKKKIKNLCTIKLRLDKMNRFGACVEVV